jgi:hypothetical protein
MMNGNDVPQNIYSGKNMLNTGHTNSTPTQLSQPLYTDPVLDGIPTLPHFIPLQKPSKLSNRNVTLNDTKGVPMSYLEYGTETQAQDEKYLTGTGEKNIVFGGFFLDTDICKSFGHNT